MSLESFRAKQSEQESCRHGSTDWSLQPAWESDMRCLGVSKDRPKHGEMGRGVEDIAPGHTSTHVFSHPTDAPGNPLPWQHSPLYDGLTGQWDTKGRLRLQHMQRA